MQAALLDLCRMPAFTNLLPQHLRPQVQTSKEATVSQPTLPLPPAGVPPQWLKITAVKKIDKNPCCCVPMRVQQFDGLRHHHCTSPILPNTSAQALPLGIWSPETSGSEKIPNLQKSTHLLFRKDPFKAWQEKQMLNSLMVWTSTGKPRPHWPYKKRQKHF